MWGIRRQRELTSGAQPPGGVQGPALPSESTVHFVLDLALRVGEVQMSSGAGAADVTATLLAVANAYGMPHCEVDVIFTSITVTCQRGVDLPPVTSLRVVRSRGIAMIAAALTVLLSGLSFVSTVQDAISGYNVTAAGRFVEVSMMTAGLIAGVVLALNVGLTLGLPSVPAIQLATSTLLRLPLQTFAGAAAAVCFALASYATPRAVVVAGLAGGAGAVAYSGLILTGAGQITASAIAATMIGFAGGVISRRLRIPPLVIAVAGMVPLLPGLTIYRGLYEMAVERSYTGLSTLMGAASVALALAAGVVLGEFLAQPIRSGLGRLERRLSGPRLAGPLRPTRRRLE